MSAFFNLQTTWNRLFNICIKLYWCWISYSLNVKGGELNPPPPVKTTFKKPSPNRVKANKNFFWIFYLLLLPVPIFLCKILEKLMNRFQKNSQIDGQTENHKFTGPPLPGIQKGTYLIDTNSSKTCLKVFNWTFWKLESLRWGSWLYVIKMKPSQKDIFANLCFQEPSDVRHYSKNHTHVKKVGHTSELFFGI